MSVSSSNASLRLPLLKRLKREPILEKSATARLRNQVLALLVLIVALIRVISFSELINEVRMKFVFNGEIIYNDEIIHFTYKGLVLIFWRAGAWIMSLFIIMGEYVLPIVCYVMLLGYLFELNNQILARRHPLWRDWLEFLITTLEFFCKFSLSDIMIQSILQRVIYTNATLVKLSSNNELGMFLTASPRPALATSIAATISLIFIFRLVELNNFRSKSDTVFFRKVKRFKRNFCCLTSSFCRDTFSKMFIILIAFFSLISLLKAFNSELLTFRITGIAGTALSEEDAVKHYYLSDVPNFIVGTATPEIQALSMTLAIYVYVTLLLLPVVYSTCAILWIIFSFERRFSIGPKVMWLSESILDFTLSNSNLEVTFIAAVSAFIELPTMARFLLMNIFPLVCTFVHQSDEKLECVDLEREVQPGMYWLLMSIILKQCVISYIYFKRA